MRKGAPLGTSPSVSVRVAVVCVCVCVCRFAQDPNWSETGDRYLLKLFRDYLFHQVTPEGEPWVDLAHVVQSLNKVRTCLACGRKAL